MQYQDLYGMILTLVLVGMVLGVGILVLGKFAATSGLTASAQTALNDSINAISPIGGTWLPLIVTVAALSIVLGLVIRSFAGAANQR